MTENCERAGDTGKRTLEERNHDGFLKVVLSLKRNVKDEMKNNKNR